MAKQTKSAQYQISAEDLNVQRQLHAYLYRLGFEPHEIAKMAECDQAVVTRDIRAVTGQATLRKHARRANIFPKALVIYAQLVYERATLPAGVSPDRMWTVLSTWLKVHDVLVGLRAVAAYAESFLHLVARPETTPYVALYLDLLFDRGKQPPAHHLEPDVEMEVWREYCRELANGSVSASADWNQLNRELCRRLMCEHQSWIWPQWTYDYTRWIEQMLKRLSGTNRQMLREVYGIGCSAKSKNMIARQQQLTRSILEVKLSHLLMGLRLTREFSLLSASLQPLRRLQERSLDLVGAVAEITRLRSELHYESDAQPAFDDGALRLGLNPKLFKPASELELSLQATNVLVKAGAACVWQVVEHTPATLKQAAGGKSFGRKTLEEIKEILGEMKLALGTTFSAEERAYLVAHTIGRKAPRPAAT